MAKATPGPWRYSDRSIIGADGELVAELTVDVTIPKAEMEANGKLIVNAANNFTELVAIVRATDADLADNGVDKSHPARKRLSAVLERIK